MLKSIRAGAGSPSPPPTSTPPAPLPLASRIDGDSNNLFPRARPRAVVVQLADICAHIRTKRHGSPRLYSARTLRWRSAYAAGWQSVLKRLPGFLSFLVVDDHPMKLGDMT